MKSMPIFNRFIGSIIDKLLILLIFLFGFAAIEGNKSIDRGFTYLSIGNFSPSMYEYATLDCLYIIDIGVPVKYSSMSEQELLERYSNTDYVGMVRSFDLTITSSFIILNILYYLLSEIFLGASVGKYRMRGRAVDALLGERITISDAFKRAIIFGLLMFLAVWLRYVFDVSYTIMIVAFFLIIDIPIFFKCRSLIDILSNVTYVGEEKQSSKVTDWKVVNGSIVVKEYGKDLPTLQEKKLESANDTRKRSKLTFNIPFFSFSKTRHYSKMKKATIYIYLMWLAINLTVLSYAMANPHRVFSVSLLNDKGEIDTRDFYPFESVDIGNYDLSEFVVYTVAIPLCLFALVKLLGLFKEISNG